MPVRVGMLSVGHVHAPSYVFCCQSSPDAKLVGLWDKDPELARQFGSDFGCKAWDERDALIDACDAVVIAGENLDHADLIEAACAKGKAILCEKPLAASQDQVDRIETAVTESGALLMTAFPCPFSPAFESAVAKVESGEIGKVLAVCATNCGKCPGGWFTEKDRSGGGAMIDHVVHVSDLLRRLLKEEPSSVHAVTGNNMYGEKWEDMAMLTIDYPSGVFATLDSSWSRPKSYKTWGDVTMKIVGEKGVIEVDLFLQSVDWYSNKTGAHGLIGYGSDLDQMVVDEFTRAVREKTEPKISMQDGLAAARLVLAGYESAKNGQPVIVG
ncbi:MAG: Gfo/Idh/MocA family oxidoreductase [Armatimonadetes bacterium]|nr:Gfo/Idh/MocA family oxidoreductase [Armatimonadota bacterium]